MAKIQYKEEDPTLLEIRKITEQNHLQEPRRKYIGASSIGEECSRKLWYDFNGYEGRPIRSPGLFAIEDGHRTEQLINSRLRLVPGIELYTEDELKKPYGFDVDGFFRGHVDGVIVGLLQAPKTPHVNEIKCVNEKKFQKLITLKQEFGEKQALQKWDYIYYCQAVVYMEMLELTRHYLICATPGGRDMTSVRTEENPKLAKILLEKAKRIAFAKQPPERIGNADYYLCKWCKFFDICHA